MIHIMILGEWHVHDTLSSYRNITILTSSNKITAFSIHSYVKDNIEFKQEAEGALSHSPEKHVWIVHLHKSKKYIDTKQSNKRNNQNSKFQKQDYNMK